MTGTITSRRWPDPIEAAAEPLLTLYRAVFEHIDDAYLLSRLPHMADPMLWIAEDEAGWVGFKLGYRRGATLLYSWLGGVHPRARGQGVASALMVRQHEAAAAQGYARVETRTRAANNAMLMLNLRHGFHVCGYEIDARGIPVVTLRKSLG
ncbi:GNAT family N-acetyltransferase [Sphingomonas sp. LB-2]|uniref:GNAT family N-acetyltransferase n=1 Tax=Sphingomonas caeni TaxID=2984949 RepID=UPI00223193DE|nr:GNAT family N-acetyltransferase [Sphingomonas caeni]MCW3849191.1 GNAT family N-acetyltransferase [Sphingomonas caeni]